MFAPSINVDFAKLQQEEAEVEEPKARKARAVPRGQRKRSERGSGKDED